MNSSPSINNNEITNNSINNGAIHCRDNSSPTINDNIIADNSVTFYGGGIYCVNSSPSITNNNIINNSVERYSGGGIYCENSSPTVEDNMIKNNYANENGGGVYCKDSSPSITNNIITNNSVTNMGGGIYFRSSSSTICNNTIVNNSANVEGDGIYITSDPHSMVMVINTIIWGNGSNQIYGDTGIIYSNVQGGWDDIGNIGADPLFVDAENFDYHLQADSPCIDAGNPNSNYSSEPEPNGDRVNMGAYGNTPQATRSEIQPPILIAYSPDFTNNPKPTLDWKDRDEGAASAYHIQIDTDADFGNPIIDNSSLTGSTYTVSSPLPEGKIQWRVSSIDVAGNESNFSEVDSFTVDTTPPETTIALSGTEGDNGWYTSDVIVELNATDNLCGVKKTEYKINEGSWQTYSSEFNVSSEGTTTVYYRSEDKAVGSPGNIEAEKSQEIKIDKTPPSVALTSPNGGEGWEVGTTHNITWTAEDTTSDIASTKLEYSIDSGSTWKPEASGEENDGEYLWTIPDDESERCRVKVTAYDNASNEAKDESDNDFAIPPQVLGDVSGNGYLSAYDAALIFQHISGLIELSEEQQNRGDVDGKVGIEDSDAELILKKVVGLIDEF